MRLLLKNEIDKCVKVCFFASERECVVKEKDQDPDGHLEESSFITKVCVGRDRGEKPARGNRQGCSSRESREWAMMGGPSQDWVFFRGTAQLHRQDKQAGKSRRAQKQPWGFDGSRASVRDAGAGATRWRP
jgi:hypothetical protein